MPRRLHLVAAGAPTEPPAVTIELEAIRRSTNLHQLEGIVRRGLKPALEVLDAAAEAAEALRRIHEAELWKSTHGSWEKYCEYLQVTRQRAHQVIQWARVNQLVDTHVPNERVARELGRAEPDPEVQQLLFAAAGGEAATASSARAVVDQHLGVERRVDGVAKVPNLQERRTPRWLFDFLSDRFGPFLLDAYAEKHNRMCDLWLSAEEDGHTADWTDVTFANPPFEDMAPVLVQALRQATRGVRSVVLGPVGCSQAWYHELAIQGTVYVPDRRINFDTPGGEPTDRADRDTIVMAFGGVHRNTHAKRGVFRVHRLELPEVPAP